MKILSIVLALFVTNADRIYAQWKQMSDAGHVKVYGAGYRNDNGRPGMFDLDIDIVRDFNRRAASAVDLKWVINGGITSVYYTQDGLKCRTTYTSNGSWDYSLRYYDERKLPAYIRHLVKSKYYDYDIRFVTEVKNASGLHYIIKMEDDVSWLTIQADDSGLKPTEQIHKL